MNTEWAFRNATQEYEQRLRDVEYQRLARRVAARQPRETAPTVFRQLAHAR